MKFSIAILAVLPFCALAQELANSDSSKNKHVPDMVQLAADTMAALHQESAEEQKLDLVKDNKTVIDNVEEDPTSHY